jgi:SAM-dependent methyltransferase
MVNIALEGARLNALITSVIELDLCDAIGAKALKVDELADLKNISQRGCQALADGMVGLRLWRVSNGHYSNTDVARKLLVRSSPDYLGDEQPYLFRFWMSRYQNLTDQVRSGQPNHALDSDDTKEFWSHLTPFLARNAGIVAQHALDIFRMADAPLALLDVGGGAAALYSRTVLQANPRATATQADWPHINAEAVQSLGDLSRRFARIDGDFHASDFGTDRYDVAVLSNIIHQESFDSNVEILTRLARALKAGGRIIISDWIVDDDRGGPAGSLFFNITMLLLSPEGKSYSRGEVARMLKLAGFGDAEFTKTPGQELLASAIRT